MRLLPHLEPVSLPLGWTVKLGGEREKYLHFPTAGIVARVHLMGNGKTTAFTVTGNEGVLGVGSFLSGMKLPSEMVVLSAGSAYRLSGELVQRELERHGALSGLLLNYTAALINEIGQNTVCNRYHSLEQQLGRWLLSCLDRLPSNELAMTQYLIAEMLGVRREGLTVAAGELQRAGLIHCRRGVIAVIDRSGLEAQCCECYAAVRSLYERRPESEGAILNGGPQRRAS
jgi:CRP-like cAMP-binding protein